MSQAITYSFRRVRAEDVPELAQLYMRCYDEPMPIETLRNKFKTEVFGASMVGCVAIAKEGQIVAYYGVYPVRMVVDGQIILGAQSGDTMTHPNHRHRGLFIELAQRTYTLARELGIGLIFGFPNENSLPGFERYLDWAFLPRMCGAEMKRRRVFWRRTRLEDIAGRLETIRMDGYPAHRSSGVSIDADYLTYKKLNAGSIEIEFGPLKVWCVPGRRIAVGGYACADLTPQEFRQAWFDLMDFAGAQAIRFCYTQDHPQLTALKACCSLHESTAVGYLAIDPEFSPRSAMHFSRGDFDYF